MPNTLVGDIIMSAREQIPDMPQVAGAPYFTANPSPGGFLDPGTWFSVMTLLTPWGESGPGREWSTILTPGMQAMNIYWSTPSDILSGLLGVRVYYGNQGSGSENQFTEFTGSQITDPLYVTNRGQMGAPPVNSSAYLPDTSGKFINNYTLFRWLNEGLNILSRKTGGILDATGISTVIGQPLYTLPFHWISLNKVWFDGWELIKGTRSDIFYRNAITAISNLTVTLHLANRGIIEIFPQPNRTAGSSLTTAVINPGDDSCAIDQAVGWVLPYGLALLHFPGGAYEVVSYSSLAGNRVSGMIRGLGGTSAAAWPAGITVSELNLRVSGYRMANNYRPGDSSLIATIPDGWGDILPIYMDSKALSVQGDKSGSAKRLQEFTKLAQELVSATQLLQGPVQIGLASTNEVYNPGLGGGWYLQ